MARREELEADLCHAAQVLNSLQCLPATDGNFSARLSKDTVLLTRSGCEKRLLSGGDLLEVALSDEYPAGASSEWLMHRALYRERDEAQAVLHVHAPYLNSFAVLQRAPNVKLLAEAAFLLREIVFVPFALPGTPALGEALLAAGRTAPVYVLGNHGAVSVGKSVKEALHFLERAEFLARVQWQAEAAGNPVELSAAQIVAMDAAYARRPA